MRGLPRGSPLHEVFYANELRVHQFPAPALISAFRPGLVGLSSSAVHPCEPHGLHPSASFCALLEVLRQPACPRDPCGTAKAPPVEFRPSSRHQHRRLPLRGFHPAVTFRPRRFARPRRFTPPVPLRACFIPLPRSGFALQGFDPHRGAVPIFTGRVMPSCWLNPSRLRFNPLRLFVLPTSRLCSPR